MPSPRWLKIINDLKVNRSRTLLAVLAIFTGVFALGLVSGLSANLSAPLAESYTLTNPASAILYTSPISDEQISSVLSGVEITHAQGRHRLRVRVSPAPGEWYNLELYAIKDFNDITVNTLESTGGIWPPGPGQIVLEHSVPGFMPGEEGDSLLLELDGDRQVSLMVAGFARDLSLPPAPLAGRGYGYISFDTLAMLEIEGLYNELYIVSQAQDRAGIGRIAADVRDSLAQGGVLAYRTKIPEPGQHTLQGILDTVMLVLSLVGWLVLASGGLLVANIINAILARQVKEIGVMKAMGAGTGQVAGIYLIMVLVLGILALIPAIPAAWLAARVLSGMILSILNFPAAAFVFPPATIGLQAAVALLVPLAAASVPILGSARVTVRRALSDYGISGGKVGLQLPGVPRLFLVAARSTLSRRGRLVMTLIALSLSGAVFVSVFSIQASLAGALDNLTNYWHYDVEANFENLVDAESARASAENIPGVRTVEGWQTWFATYLRPDESENENLTIVAPPAGSNLIKPSLVQGRWLVPSDTNAIVVNADFIYEEADVEVGRTISLNISGKEGPWEVVGIITGQIMGPVAYVNQEYISTFMGQTGMLNRLVLGTDGSGTDEQIAEELAGELRQNGFSVSEVETSEAIVSRLDYWFTVPILLLLAMAGLLAIVGAIGLMGTMSISVLERRREIGVMRAIGASTPAILRIFVGEAVLIGLFSCLAGSLLAIPIGWVMGDVVGLALLKAPLLYIYSLFGAGLWLAISLSLAVLVSFLPAWKATRIRVREALSYE